MDEEKAPEVPPIEEDKSIPPAETKLMTEDDFKLLKDEMDVRITTNHIDAAMLSITESLHGRKMTKLNIMRVAAHVMGATSSMNDLSGSMKKRVLLSSFEVHIKKDNNLSSEEKDELMFMVYSIVDNAVDVFQDIKEGREYISGTTNKKPGTCCLVM